MEILANIFCSKYSMLVKILSMMSLFLTGIQRKGGSKYQKVCTSRKRGIQANEGRYGREMSLVEWPRSLVEWPSGQRRGLLKSDDRRFESRWRHLAVTFC